MIQLFETIAICLITEPKIHKTYMIPKAFSLMTSWFSNDKPSMSEDIFSLAYTIKESLCILADNLGMECILLKVLFALKSRYKKECWIHTGSKLKENVEIDS